MTKVAETKVHGANVVAVPPSVRTCLNLEKGDYVEWHLQTFTEVKKEMKNPTIVVLKKREQK